jgi:hypothetical protein
MKLPTTNEEMEAIYDRYVRPLEQNTGANSSPSVWTDASCLAKKNLPSFKRRFVTSAAATS